MARPRPTSHLDAEFNAFLHATLGVDANEMPLSMLSALARLGVDPWGTAAELAGLPRGAAAQRLSSMLSSLPGRPLATPGCNPTVDGLIGLLPRETGPKALTTGPLANVGARIDHRLLIICCMLAMVAISFFGAQRAPRPPAPGAVSSAVQAR